MGNGLRFFMISDLHLYSGMDDSKIRLNLEKLCVMIRSEISTSEKLVFIFLGDIINKHDISAYSIAEKYLNYILRELKDYSVEYNFLPGNHEIEDDGKPHFNSFISKFSTGMNLLETSAFSKIYQDVNFIFADSNLLDKHDKPGKLNLEDIRKEVKPNMQNILFCHHGLLQSYGGTHDVVLNGYEVYETLKNCGISMVFHGHTHCADSTIPKDGFVEISCGSFSKDLATIDGLYNQFNMGYIRDGKVVSVERYILSIDGTNTYPTSRLYPEEKTFKDPNEIGKIKYNEDGYYIERTVLPHETAIKDAMYRIFSDITPIPLMSAFLTSNKVLLLSDAGRGKSTELKRMAARLYQTTLFPFLFELRNYLGEKIEDLLPAEYVGMNYGRLALILDGYDELSEKYKHAFEIQINSFVEKNPEAKILISSRSNFCKIEKTNISSTFKNFFVFDLCQLNYDDVKCFLERQGINVKYFYDSAKTSGILELLNNPFYLDKIVELYIKDKKLPVRGRLMDTLVENSFSFDDQKYVGGLEEHYVELLDLLEKVAFAMQLLRVQSLSDISQYQVIFESEERELIRCSGIFVRKSDEWMFVHNNFREYLAAKYLSKLTAEEVKHYIADRIGIKPSWVNVFAYLSGMELEWDIIEWISDFAPIAIVKVERDRVEPHQRFTIFKGIFEDNEKKQLWLDNELYDDVQLAEFSYSNKSIEYLIEKIKNPVNEVSLITAIKILRHYHGLFGKEDEVLSCLFKCITNFPNTPGYICRAAIYSVYQLGLDSNQITEKLMKTFEFCEDDYVRLGIYEYLTAVDRQNEYVHFFLDGIKYIGFHINSDDNRIGNEAFELVNGLQSMYKKEGVMAVLDWYAQNGLPDFHNADSVFKHNCEMAIKLYKDGYIEINNNIINCTVTMLKKYNHGLVKTIIKYFLETDTLESGMISIIKAMEDEIWNLGELFFSGIDAGTIVIEAFRTGRYTNSDVIFEIANRFISEDGQYDELQCLLKERGGLSLPDRGEKIDYESERRARMQRSFDMLFDRTLAESILNSIIEELGSSEITIRELKEKNIKLDYKTPFWHDYISILNSGLLNVKIGEFLNEVNWDHYILKRVSGLLEGKTSLNVSVDQKKTIEKIAQRQIENNIFEKQIYVDKSGVRVSYIVLWVIFLLQYFDFALTTDEYLKLVSLPYYCFGKGDCENKYEFLTKYLTKEQLLGQIEDNISKPNIGIDILEDHIKYCKEKNSSIAVTVAVEICKTEKDSTFIRHTSLDYLHSMCGDEFICDEILPYADASLLLEIAAICKDICKKDLCIAMEQAYSTKPSLHLMKYLISYGSKIAIADYVSYLEKNYSTPEKNDNHGNGPTRAILCLSDISLSPYFDRMIKIIFDERFVDDEFCGLRSTLRDTLIKCGSVDQDAMIELMESNLELATKDEDIRYCNYIINEICRNNRNKSDIPLQIREVKAILKEH